MSRELSAFLCVLEGRLEHLQLHFLAESFASQSCSPGEG